MSGLRVRPKGVLRMGFKTGFVTILRKPVDMSNGAGAQGILCKGKHHAIMPIEHEERLVQKFIS